MFKLNLEKAEEPEIKLPTSIGSQKQQESSRKISASLTTLKPLPVWITTNCGKFFKRWEYQTTLPASWGICMQVKKQQLEQDMEQWSGCRVHQGCILSPAYWTYMQSTSCEMLGWMKHKLKSRLPGEISITSDMQILWPPDEKSWLIRKDSNAGKDWRQDKNRATEDKIGWCHWINRHEFE